jgi:hypothetical protein
MICRSAEFPKSGFAAAQKDLKSGVNAKTEVGAAVMGSICDEDHPVERLY